MGVRVGGRVRGVAQEGECCYFLLPGAFRRGSSRWSFKEPERTTSILSDWSPVHPPFDTQRLTITKGFERLNSLKVCLWESSMQNAAKSPCRQSFELRRGRSFVWIGLLTALAPQCPRLMTPFEMRKGLQTLLLSPHCTSETHAEDLRPPPSPQGQSTGTPLNRALGRVWTERLTHAQWVCTTVRVCVLCVCG